MDSFDYVHAKPDLDSIKATPEHTVASVLLSQSPIAIMLSI